MLKLELRAHNDTKDVNDPQGMLMSSARKTIDVTASGIQSTVDFAVTNNWQPTTPTAPVGAFFLTLLPGMEDLFDVGDMVIYQLLHLQVFLSTEGLFELIILITEYGLTYLLKHPLDLEPRLYRTQLLVTTMFVAVGLMVCLPQ